MTNGWVIGSWSQCKKRHGIQCKKNVTEQQQQYTAGQALLFDLDSGGEIWHKMGVGIKCLHMCSGYFVVMKWRRNRHFYVRRLQASCFWRQFAQNCWVLPYSSSGEDVEFALPSLPLFFGQVLLYFIVIIYILWKSIYILWWSIYILWWSIYILWWSIYILWWLFGCVVDEGVR